MVIFIILVMFVRVSTSKLMLHKLRGGIYIIIRTHPHVYTSYFVLTSVLPLNSRMANVEHTNNINSIRKTMPRFVCFSLV